MKWKIAAAALIAGTSAQALAQTGAPVGQPPAGATDSMAAVRTSREQQDGFDRIVNSGVKVEDEQGRERLARRRAPGPVAATAADITAGAAVRAVDGLQIATIERLEADGAVVRAGDRLAKLPLDAFGKDDGGLLIAITAAEFQAAIAASSVPVPVEEPEIAAATAADMALGAAIRDSEGVPIGTVLELVENGVIVLTDGRKVKLAVESFGKDDHGLLLGITANEFKAMIGNPAPAGG